MAFQAMPYKMETVTAPLGHRRNDKWELTALRPCIMIALRLEHFWTGLLILARILATSDGKTLRIDGLSGFPAMSYKMDTVTAPLGHMEERKVGVDCPPAMHHDCLEAGALLGC